LIGSGSDPESQAGRHSYGYGIWCLELRRGGRRGIRIGFVEDDMMVMVMMMMMMMMMSDVM